MTPPRLHLPTLGLWIFLAWAASSALAQNTSAPAAPASTPTLQWTSSTPTDPWKELTVSINPQPSATQPNTIKIDPATVYQSIDGFGGCFNELGWTALQALPPDQQAIALKALFSPSGCNFNLCRAPIGANDFALQWYSYDESPGDYAMANFTIDRDRQYLSPYIKAAMQDQPNLAVWGVPWCPPSWMKTNNQYQGGQMRQDPQTLAAYALYFSKYVQAYRAAGINLYAIHPQNEPLYNNNIYPQCAWNGDEIHTFLSDYLVPQLKKDHLDVQVWLGTIVSKNLDDYVNPVLGDPAANPTISGVGYQYGGQNAFLATHLAYPDKKMLQTETECYHGENTWTEALTTFCRIVTDLNNFANGYDYWNMILSEKATSTWGWKQNSLLKIDADTKTITYDPEFYSLKHFGHFVQPGATRIAWSASPGTNGDLLSNDTVIAFHNPSGELVVVLANINGDALPVTVQAGTHSAHLNLPPVSMNTLVLTGW
ncbi:MAG: glycoside hydrolase family 30 protein [Opitutales bacterium]